MSTLRRIVSAALSEAVDSLEEKEPAPSFPWGLLIPVGFGGAIFMADVIKRTKAWGRSFDASLQRIEERLAGMDSDRYAVRELSAFLALRYAGHPNMRHGEHPVKTAVRLLTPHDGSEEAWERMRAVCSVPQAVIPGEYRANIEGDVIRVSDLVQSFPGNRPLFKITNIAGDPRKIGGSPYAPTAIIEHWPIALKGAPGE